jgi:hypothetical protein
MNAADLIIDFVEHEPGAVSNGLWLTQQTAFAAAFPSVDHLATAEENEVDAKKLRGFNHHLRYLRGGIARTFMRRDCFVGLSVIDDLIYQAVVAGVPDVPAEVIRTIIGHGLHDPGMVVIPLHGFGIAQPMRAFVSSAHAELRLPSGGLVVMAQTNDIDRTISLLDAARGAMGIADDFDAQGIRAYSASNRLGWLRRNPLMAFRFNSYSHDPYENQLFYQLRMRTMTALLLIASLLAPASSSDLDSARANNHETLDIDHYLRIEISPRLGRLEAERIPRNVDQLSLAEASDVDVRISLDGWNDLLSRGELDQVYETLRQVESGYLSHQILDKRETKEASLYAKMTRSLDYFRRSFRANARPSERVIALAIAFESLLTDSYSGGVTARIMRRAAICLNEAGSPAAQVGAIAQLFDARGKYVHSGFGPEDFSLHDARRAYVACLSTVTRLAQKAILSDPVIGTLLGDKPAAPPLSVRVRQAWRALRGS